MEYGSDAARGDMRPWPLPAAERSNSPTRSRARHHHIARCKFTIHLPFTPYKLIIRVHFLLRRSTSIPASSERVTMAHVLHPCDEQETKISSRACVNLSSDSVIRHLTPVYGERHVHPIYEFFGEISFY